MRDSRWVVGWVSFGAGEWGGVEGVAGGALLFRGCLGVGLRFAVRLLLAWGGCWMRLRIVSRYGIESLSGCSISSIACHSCLLL